jgi:hypothetical protein
MAATGVAAGTSGQATQSMPKLKFVKRRITHGPSDLLRCVYKMIFINSLPQAVGMQLLKMFSGGAETVNTLSRG